MVSILSNLLATAIILGGLLLRFTNVPSGLVSSRFLDAVGTVIFLAGLALLIFLALAAVLERKAGHEKIFTSHDWLYVVGGFAVLAIFTGVMTGWISGLFGGVRLVIDWAIDPKTGRFPALVLCVPLTLSAGLILFAIRLHVRTVYGVTEVTVGLVVALWQVLNASPDKPLLEFGTLIGLLTAGVYLVVRGLDNVYVGWKAEEPDFFVRKLRKALPMKKPTRKPAQEVVSTTEVAAGSATPARPDV